MRALRPGRTSAPLLALVAFVFLFMYLPMILIIVFSFNSSQVTILPLEHFSLRWYQELFSDGEILASFKNTLIVGAATVVLALILGGTGAFALNRLQFRGKAVYEFIVTMPFVLRRS